MGHRTTLLATTTIMFLLAAPSPSDAGPCDVLLGPEALHGGMIGYYYRQALVASGGTPPYRFVLSSGTLPVGTKLSPGGVLSGTISVRDGNMFTVTATDAAGCTASRTYHVSICFHEQITPDVLPDAAPGQPYDELIRVSGATSPTQLQIWGRLPPGLHIEWVTGVTSRLHGIPQETGGWGFKLGGGDCGYVYRDYVLNVRGLCLPVEITTEALPDAVQGRPYTAKIEASGGCEPLGITAAPLPPGLTFTPDGKLSGVPWEPGRYSVQVRAAAGTTDSRAYTLTVHPARIMKPVDGAAVWN